MAGIALALLHLLPRTPPPRADSCRRRPTRRPLPCRSRLFIAANLIRISANTTMTGAVEANSKTLLRGLGQDQVHRRRVVLAPTLQKPAEANGCDGHRQLIVRSARSALKDYTIDLSPEDQAKFKGKPVVLATAVINTAGVDIAKKPIPAMSADELALQKIMTKLPPAQAALRKALDASSADLTKEQATILKTAFTEIETFFKAKGNDEATKWAADGKRHADSVLMNVANANFDAAKTSITPLGATCASCHGKYRERMEDGTFRMKPTE
jgi:cytochrome c556